ncbi:MAG TPA: SET domain-containing protein [Acidimicrobiales bacterium]|nr:SET domain-containing protein [Acidimicrobiales bacterium]
MTGSVGPAPRPIDALAVLLLDGAPCVETIAGSEVRASPVQGRGLFALRSWAVGETLGMLDGQVVDVDAHPGVEALEWNALSPTRLLVRAVRTSYGFMNHRAGPTGPTGPNVDIVDDGRRMVARLPIAPGDELTLDYFAQPCPPTYLASPEALALRASRL